MHGASWQHGAPSLASATVADKAGVDHTTIFPAEGGEDLAGNDGTSSSKSGGSGWVSCARRSSWGWQIWRGMWSDGGHRGAMSNRWGAVFRCRTLVWVVRNIPQKNRHYTHQWTRLSCETNFRS